LSVDVGNPHTVVALGTQDELSVLDLTSPPRVEPEPPQGSNVEFVVPLGEVSV
jgi:diaminopimelate epimerase